MSDYEVSILQGRIRGYLLERDHRVSEAVLGNVALSTAEIVEEEKEISRALSEENEVLRKKIRDAERILSAALGNLSVGKGRNHGVG